MSMQYRSVQYQNAKLAQHLRLRRREAFTTTIHPVSKACTLLSFLLWSLQAYVKTLWTPTGFTGSMRLRGLQVICSQAGLMPGTIKHCSAFQLPHCWGRVFMEASPVLQMRSLRLSIQRPRLIWRGSLWVKVSVSTITPVKRLGFLLTRLLTHTIHYVICMLHNVRFRLSFGIPLLTTPVVWYKYHSAPTWSSTRRGERGV